MKGKKQESTDRLNLRNWPILKPAMASLSRRTETVVVPYVPPLAARRRVKEGGWRMQRMELGQSSVLAALKTIVNPEQKTFSTD